MGIEISAVKMLETTLVSVGSVHAYRESDEAIKQQLAAVETTTRNVHKQNKSNWMKLFAQQPQHEKSHAKQIQPIHQPVSRSYR